MIVASLPRLDTFCHATVHGGIVRVAGTLGTTGATLQDLTLATGVAEQTTLAMRNIETILVRTASRVLCCRPRACVWR